jgi:hypothetical protein
VLTARRVVFVAVEGYLGGFPISDGPRKASSAMSCPFSRLKKANRSSMAGRTVAASQKIAMVTVGGEVIPFARATLLPADRAQKSHEKRLAIAKALGDLVAWRLGLDTF